MAVAVPTAENNCARVIVLLSPLDARKDELACDVFIEPADEDYIAARWLFLNRLYRPFFWNAAQALEKYLKAALVLNGRPSWHYTHDLTSLFSAVQKFAADFIPENLTPPHQLENFREMREVDLWGEASTHGFIAHVNAQGDPHNRYNHFGCELECADLHKLDQLVFALRNVATKLDAAVQLDGKLHTWAELMRAKPNCQFRDFKPHLVYKGSATPGAREAARNNNFAFAADTFEHTRVPFIYSSSVPLLEIAAKNTKISEFRQLRTWATDYVLGPTRWKQFEKALAERDTQRAKRRRS